MKKMNHFLTIIGSAMLLTLVACEKHGSVDKAANKASESINKAVDNVKDAVKDVTKKTEDALDK